MIEREKENVNKRKKTIENEKARANMVRESGWEREKVRGMRQCCFFICEV
jgi:hypothetical protein